MAASRALAAGVRCNACRTSVLRSFASLAGLDVSASGLSRARPTARAFSTAPLRLSDSRSRKAPAEDEDDGELAPGANVPSDAQDASVPWYLKVDAPQRPLDTAAHPLADKQRIPALPEHSPPVLEPFLQYVSVDLGIDDLTLLDLRNLDPPPALGANLLMLFGTARSEKHLHVSADRLCRWLRSNYKLSPHADGLLGRNELKLKLRRKARKARMLSNAGASENSLAADDGIRTGWICVNVGSIKAADSAPVAVSEEASFVGFGGGSEGVSIVLQLFTEDKRAELDLEGLWNGVLKTDRRRKEAQSPGEDTEHTEDATNNPNGAVIADRTVAKHSSQLQHGNPQAPLQARAYHTTRARQHGTRLALARARETPWANSWSRTWRSSMSTLSDTGAPLLGKIAPSQLRDQAKPDQLSEAIGLASKLEQLYQMSRDEKLEALGKGSGRERKDLSPFLEEFYSYIPEFPDVVHWEAIMQLYLSAISENHPGYPLFLLHDVFQEMQIAGIRVPERMFLAGLRAILSREHSHETEEATARRRNQIVFALLYAMQGHSYPVITDDIIIMLHDSVSMLHSDLEAQHADAALAEKRAAYHQAVRHELLHQIDMLAIPLKRDTYAHLLRSYAILGDMKGMWHVWRSTALAMLPRSAQMYAIALNGVAFTGNQVDCIKALRDCLAQMGQEIPPVSLRGDVREAVMRCLLVVEPDVEQSYEQGGRQGEWVKYWNECMRSLQREKADKNSGSGRVLSNRGILGQFRTSKLSRA